MKSNLFFFFVLCFFSPLFELEKNKNTWSRQAKFVEVDPTQKIIFLSAYSSRFKQLMTKIEKSVFATNHNQTSNNFLSIFLCVHGKYYYYYQICTIETARGSCQLALFTLSVTATVGDFWLFFFFSSTCKFSQCRCQRRLVIYQTWKGFHSRNLTKFFAERLTITAIPKTGIIILSSVSTRIGVN